ncbi:hypothetical protein BDC45DRAFT_534651 [Circinella umbellata]|nr:hypothetical protein BDC45DRAFT_534651 [Circinella umbellata]
MHRSSLNKRYPMGPREVYSCYMSQLGLVRSRRLRFGKSCGLYLVKVTLVSNNYLGFYSTCFGPLDWYSYGMSPRCIVRHLTSGVRWVPGQCIRAICPSLALFGYVV